jgi:chorismate synthase
MSSTLGNLFKISTWGESHGQALGVVVDGCPAGLVITEADIQSDLDRRRPGQSSVTTPRKEADRIQILSGTFQNKSTGTPISMMLFNEDQRSHDYSDMQKMYRPSHADYTYDAKYGFRDYRGGGRSSARETVGRVAAGSIARKLLLQQGIEILAWVDQVHTILADIDPMIPTLEMVEQSVVRCPDAEASKQMEERILTARSDQDSVGGCITLRITGLPAGIGEPVFDRLEALLAMAMMSIPATKGFEVGTGFRAAALRGSEHNDAIYHDGVHFRTRTNHAGGVVGGISNGEPVICRIAFKPTATISRPQETADKKGHSETLIAKGRHDPCVATRAPVIVESMAAIVLADLWLQQRARQGLKTL